MGVLAAKSQWPTEVHRLASTDPLEGGLGGISNRQPLQIADRMLFLLDTVDAVERLAAALLADVGTVATRPPEVPAPGKLRVAVRELARLQIAWDAVAGAQRYDIRTRRVGDAWGAPASAGVATSMWVTPLVQGTSYSFQARTAKRRSVAVQDYPLVDGKARLADTAALALVVKGTGAKSGTTYVAGTDYEHDAATGVLTRKTTGAIGVTELLSVAYELEDLSDWNGTVSGVTYRPGEQPQQEQ